MRVLVLTADYGASAWSGIGVVVSQLSETLAALGVDVCVLVGGPRNKQAFKTGSARLKVRSLDEGTFPVDPRNFDWVHVHSLALTELALELRRRYPLRLAYTVHTQPWVELQGSAQAGFWHRAQSLLFAASDCVIFLSEAERANAKRLFPRWPLRSRVVPNSVPSPPKRLPGCGRRSRMVFSGRFSRSKGVLLLEQCIAEILRRHPTHFVIAGGHGDIEGSQAIARIQRRHRECCDVVGWLSREELDRLFSRASLVLVPSLYEPFGMVAVEAMRMGAPVLASDTGGLRETVRERSGGVLVRSRDPEEWAQEALKIVLNPAVAQRLHLQGPGYVSRHFRSRVLARKMIDEVYARRG